MIEIPKLLGKKTLFKDWEEVFDWIGYSFEKIDHIKRKTPASIIKFTLINERLTLKEMFEKVSSDFKGLTLSQEQILETFKNCPKQLYNIPIFVLINDEYAVLININKHKSAVLYSIADPWVWDGDIYIVSRQNSANG